MKNSSLIRRAFSLVELLVVISIIVLLLAIAVPAFSSMLYSSEQSLAESSLRIGLSTARDLAARSPTGQDAAAVFLYDRDSKKTTILICSKAGVLPDRPPSGTTSRGTTVPREVFAPAPGVDAIQMSSGWTVRGYAMPNTIDTGNDGWYSQTYQPGDRNRGNWVFPETSFFNDVSARNEGDDRQTFMVRFEGGTGLVTQSNPAEVLVLSASPGTSFRSNWPGTPGYIQNNDPNNVENEPDGVRFVRRVLAWPTTGGGSISLNRKQEILGNESSDTIMAKPVGQLALCNESRLAKALGVRLDNGTGSLYVGPPANITSAYGPQFIANVTTARINEWIENRLLSGGDPVESDCRVFTLQRYLGWLQEVTGTSRGLGVGS